MSSISATTEQQRGQEPDLAAQALQGVGAERNLELMADDVVIELP
jgi:hypothetical protein